MANVCPTLLFAIAGDLLGAYEFVDNDEQWWVAYQEKELNNGRLAMYESSLCQMGSSWLPRHCISRQLTVLMHPL